MAIVTIPGPHIVIQCQREFILATLFCITYSKQNY